MTRSTQPPRKPASRPITTPTDGAEDRGHEGDDQRRTGAEDPAGEVVPAGLRLDAEPVVGRRCRSSGKPNSSTRSGWKVLDVLPSSLASSGAKTAIRMKNSTTTTQITATLSLRSRSTRSGSGTCRARRLPGVPVPPTPGGPRSLRSSRVTQYSFALRQLLSAGFRFRDPAHIGGYRAEASLCGGLASNRLDRPIPHNRALACLTL